jgi:hypothetical protein
MPIIWTIGTIHRVTKKMIYDSQEPILSVRATVLPTWRTLLDGLTHNLKNANFVNDMH